MSWLKTSEERQSNYVLENPNHPVAKAFFMGDGNRAVTGRPVNDQRALSLSAIYNAVSVIAGDLATVSLKLYRARDDGGREEERGHALWDLLTLSPAEGITSADWREASQGHLLLRGNAYSEIVRMGNGHVDQLRIHAPTDVQRVTVEGTSVYKIVPERRWVMGGDMLHVHGPGGNGIDGWSVIKLARENWGLASALEESNARFIANASRPSGFLTTEASMKPDTLAKIRDLWGKRNTGLDNVGGTPVLDGGFTWQQVGLSAEDSQYIESRKLSINDIARWFNIPPHMIKDLDRATFSNIEHQAIEYVRGTLLPWAIRWQQHLDLKLLTEKERRAGLFIAFNLDSKLQGDVQTRSQAQKMWLESGAMTPNEIRRLENRPALPGGDRALIRMDMMPLDRIDEVQEVETDEEGRTRVRFYEQRGSGERERTETPREIRSPDMRLQLRASFEPLILGGAERMVKGEVRDVKRLLAKMRSEGWTESELRQRLEAYYFDEYPALATSWMGHILRSYAEAVARAAAEEIAAEVAIDAGGFADEYTEGFVARYAGRSRRDLMGVETDQIESRLNVWVDGDSQVAPKPQQVANREAVKLGDFIARQTFIAGGIGYLVWRSIGDSCPYCTRLNGKRIDPRTSFIQAGEEFEGEGSDVPLVPKNNVSHAPAHRGCNCTIVPGI